MYRSVIVLAALCFVHTYGTRVTSYFATNEFNVKPTPVVPVVYTTEIGQDNQQILPTRVARSLQTRLPPGYEETYATKDEADKTPTPETADVINLVPLVVASEVQTTGDLSSVQPTGVLHVSEDFHTQEAPLSDLSPPKA